MSDCFTVVIVVTIDSLSFRVVPLLLATVDVLSGAPVLDVPLVGGGVPGGLVEVSLWCDTTTATSVPAVEVDTLFALFGVTGDGVVVAKVVVAVVVAAVVVKVMGTVVDGGDVVLAGVAGVSDLLVTAGVVGLVVGCSNVMVVTVATVLGVMSLFTVRNWGPASLLVLASVGTTTIDVVVELTSAASPASTEKLLRRKPEEEKRRHDCEQTGDM